MIEDHDQRRNDQEESAGEPERQRGADRERGQISAGSVRWRSVRIDAAKTSFQEMMKTKIADAASPGSASGRMTLHERADALQPSVIAASSSSGENPAKMLDVVEHDERERERRVRDRDAEHGVVDAPADEDRPPAGWRG